MNARDTTPPAPERRHRTLLDIYAERDFQMTDAQVRRIVSLLRLTEPRPAGAQEGEAA